MDGRPSAFWPSGWRHQFVEEMVTLRVRAARADKATIEVDEETDDTDYRTVWRAVEHRIEPVSSISRGGRRARGLVAKCKNVGHR